MRGGKRSPKDGVHVQEKKSPRMLTQTRRQRRKCSWDIMNERENWPPNHYWPESAVTVTA